MNAEISQPKLIELPHPWLIEDIAHHEAQTSFEGVGRASIPVISRLGHPVTMISGPMTTGGDNSLEANLAAYEKVIRYYQALGRKVFNQLPAEGVLRRLKNAWQAERSATEYCYPLLEGYYGTLFRRGFVSELILMPNWMTSVGSTWEHALAHTQGMKIGFHRPD